MTDICAMGPKELTEREAVSATLYQCLNTGSMRKYCYDYINHDLEFSGMLGMLSCTVSPTPSWSDQFHHWTRLRVSNRAKVVPSGMTCASGSQLVLSGMTCICIAAGTKWNDIILHHSWYQAE